MISQLSELNITVCGGDSRELELYRIFRQKGLNLKMVGFDRTHDISAADRVGLENLNGIDVLVLPIRGFDENGRIYSNFSRVADPRGGFQFEECDEEFESYHVESMLRNYKGKNLLVLVGSMEDKLRREVPSTVRFVITTADKEFMQLNSIPTAEGAIMKAMEVFPSTIHSSRILILGLGKCGITLALMLKGLGARVTAVVR
ncbi:MAG: hypothetical protein GX887_02345, partial [Firmicutes bacterium]|nr:hypothetical protein [Bacillota bacterium]